MDELLKSISPVLFVPERSSIRQNVRINLGNTIPSDSKRLHMRSGRKQDFRFAKTGSGSANRRLLDIPGRSLVGKRGIPFPRQLSQKIPKNISASGTLGLFQTLERV